MSPYNITTKSEIKAFQAIIIDYFSETRRTCARLFINRVSYFQFKGFPCFETQLKIGKSYNASRKCINQTTQELNRLGVLRIKKKRLPGERWLRNEYMLDPIMFTKEVVECLFGILSHNYFKNYFPLERVTLIQQKLSSVQNYKTKKSEHLVFDFQSSGNAAKWDQLLKSTAI